MCSSSVPWSVALVLLAVTSGFLWGQTGRTKSPFKPKAKAAAEGTADSAPTAEKPAEEGKRQPQPGDIVTLKDGTKGYFVEFDKHGYVNMQVPLGRVGILVPHFAKVDKIVSIEPAPKKVDPRRQKRVWTDVTGKFKTEASYIRVHDGKVELKKVDGSIAKVPLNKLSAGDLRIAQTLATEDELAQTAGDMFAGSPIPEAMAAMRQTDAPGISTIEPNWSECRQVTLDEQTPSGEYTPDPSPMPAAALIERPILIPRGFRGPDVTEEPEKLIFVRGKAQALLISRVFARRNELKRLMRCDLATGKVLESLPLPADSVPLDADAEGRVLVGHTPFGISNLGRVDVFGIESAAIKLIASWRPYPVIHRGAALANEYDTVRHAAVIDKDHILTVDPALRMTIWKAAEAKALYTVPLGELPAVSGSGKYVAVASSRRQVYVIEALTGKVVAKFPWLQPFAPQLAFHPDGRQLAGVRREALRVWDLTTGQSVHELNLYLTKNNHNNDIDISWPADGFLLHGQNLVDLKRGILLWHYRMEATTRARGSFGGRYWNLEETERGHIIASTPLPHAQALRVAEALHGDNLVAVKPGVEFALDIRVAVPENEQQAIRETLTKRLTESGMKVVPMANLVLHAATTAGPPEEVYYRRRDEPSYKEGKKVTINRQISTVWITENNRPIWVAAQYIGPPSELVLENKDLLQSAVNEQMRPEADFFLIVELPSRVIRPGSDPTEAYGNDRIIDLTIK